MRLSNVALALFLGCGPVAAQDAGTPPPPADQPAAKDEPTDAEKAFEDAVRAAEKAIRGAKAYTLKAEAAWKHSGPGGDRSGTNVAEVTAAGADKLRLEIFAPGVAGRYVAAADGKTLTRLYTAANLYSVTPTDQPLHELQTDGLTVAGLREVGVDFILHPDMHGAVMAQTVRVEDLGETGDKERKVRAFRVGLVNGRTVEVRFAAGPEPLPISLRTTAVIPTDEKTVYKLIVETKLTWDLAARPVADVFTVAIPAGAKKVDDLTDELRGQVTEDAIGQPAGPATFIGLDDKPVDIADWKGKSVLVVYSWATWSAPSTDDMAGLNRFVAAYTGKGVTFLAVNAGESADAAKAYAEKAGYKGTVVLDPKGEGLASLKLQTVPGAVILDKDGTVRAYHRGGKPHTKDAVKKDLDTLLKGEQPAPKK